MAAEGDVGVLVQHRLERRESGLVMAEVELVVEDQWQAVFIALGVDGLVALIIEGQAVLELAKALAVVILYEHVELALHVHGAGIETEECNEAFGIHVAGCYGLLCQEIAGHRFRALQRQQYAALDALAVHALDELLRRQVVVLPVAGAPESADMDVEINHERGRPPFARQQDSTTARIGVATR